MIDIKENIQLAPYTTFNIGGDARYFVEVSGEEGLRSALVFAGEKKLRFVILSGGSNVLFSDDGFDGLVIRMVSGDDAKKVVIYNNKVIVDAGANLTETIRSSGTAGLSGWESMCGIPGSVGGAVRGNAGAFGTEIKDVLSKARAMNLQTGEVRDFNTKECEFGYRTSYFKTHPQWVVLTAVFNLEVGLQSDNKIVGVGPLQKCEQTVTEREKRHLQDVQCAGSFFKNPVCTGYPEVIKQFEDDRDTVSRGDKVPSGYLIEMAGLRGTARVGGAYCSDQHADYIINTGDATAKDVLELRDIIKKGVKEKFGIELEEEVTIIQ